MPSTFEKDVQAVLDYAFDWKPHTNGRLGAVADWLESGETIAEYVVTVPSGLTKDTDSQANGVVTVWLSGGTAGASYDVTCKITTSAGRTDRKNMTFRCVAR